MSKKQARAVECLQQGLALHGAGRPADALAAYQRAIMASPDLARAHEARGIALAQLSRAEEALKSLNRAAGLDRSNANVLVNRGTVLNELKRPEEALRDFEQAISIDESSAAAHYGAGNALLKLKRYKEALERFDRAIELQPRFAQALDGRGQALVGLNRRDEALESYNAAIGLDSATADHWYNRGICQMALRQFRAAVDDFYHAINLNPKKAEYHLGAAAACNEIGYLEDALARVMMALELKPNDIEMLIQRGNIRQVLEHFDEAIEDFDRILERQPEDAAIYCYRDMALRYIHDWRRAELGETELARLLEITPSVPPPFLVLSMSTDAALQKSVAVRYAKPFEKVVRPALPAYERRDRIRIGYFSADFHNHATMYLMAEMLEHRDRERFEVTAFSFGPDDGTPWRRRAEQAVDRFIDVRAKTDVEIANEARELEIDIAIDLKGSTLHARPYIYAARPAPVLVSYLGYPGTMGCSFIDYIIADPVVIPRDHSTFYTEKVVSLPDSYQPNCRQMEVDSAPIMRADAGLSEDALVYCSFNQSYKVNRRMFEVWMRILAEVEGSVLWMWVQNEGGRERLREEASARGVDPSRLVFAEGMPLPKHLNRVRLADLFLDTLPYNAHTTASDALRMGLPIITCPGQSFASRVAASLLTAAGFPELIAASLDEYEAMAIALGRNRERLHALKTKVARQAPVSPLYDSRRYARHIEAAYEAIYERLMAGLPPDHIDVAPIH